MEKFIIIDGNSLINRAFYALPPLKSVSGKPCGAIFGFLNMMLNLIKAGVPAEKVVASATQIPAESVERQQLFQQWSALFLCAANELPGFCGTRSVAASHSDGMTA